MTTPLALARQMLGILYNDADRLSKMDDYLHGKHADPYMPDRADEEYKLLAKRSVSNWIPLLVSTPAQACYLDNFRRGVKVDETDSNDIPRVTESETSTEMAHWQRSRLDARQAAIYRGALSYGHSFTITELKKKKAYTKGLSALRTAALFEDPANDDTPYALLTVVKYPKNTDPGKARMWDDTYEYAVTFKSLAGYNDDKGVTVKVVGKHGAKECPGTRFTAWVDLEGRTVGVIEPMIAVQDRINQTVFDLLVAQTYNSFQVRGATGMVPPTKRDPDTGEELIDEDTGLPIPVDINMNQRRFLFAEDHEARFFTLPGSSLDGYINSIDMSIRHLAAISQTPPHHLLGQIANLSAEALTAAETSLSRKVEEFRHGFGESWERVFRLAAEMEGDLTAAEDFEGEVIWRDMENRSMAQTADALGKLADALGVPKRGLWPRVPGATQRELELWEELADQDPEIAMAQALQRANPLTAANGQPPQSTKSTVGNLTPKTAA